MSNTGIAERLSVMERTVESHIARIFAKGGGSDLGGTSDAARSPEPTDASRSGVPQ
jgi:DNA-binding NarL/FixJ family response regulator